MRQGPGEDTTSSFETESLQGQKAANKCSVSTPTAYGFGEWGLVPGGAAIRPHCQCVQTGSGAHIASCPVSNRQSFSTHKESGA
jgi:hypothetical protein